jgi:hypothetical protein
MFLSVVNCITVVNNFFNLFLLATFGNGDTFGNGSGNGNGNAKIN